MNRNILYTRKKKCYDNGGKLISDDSSFAQNHQKMAGALNNVYDNFDSYSQIANAAISGFNTGSKNTNQGMYDTSIGLAEKTANDASNVTNTYTAGQNTLNLMSRIGDGPVTARDLRTHKGWKNILGSTATGALAGAKIGGAWGAAIGGAIGLAGAGIGELIGWKKRKKQAEEMNRAKQEANFSVDYYNSKQAEQLMSANDNAAHSMANQNRYSVLGLMARGGRRNCLINNKHNRLC